MKRILIAFLVLSLSMVSLAKGPSGKGPKPKAEATVIPQPLPSYEPLLVQGSSFPPSTFVKVCLVGQLCQLAATDMDGNLEYWMHTELGVKEPTSVTLNLYRHTSRKLILLATTQVAMVP